MIITQDAAGINNQTGLPSNIYDIYSLILPPGTPVILLDRTSPQQDGRTGDGEYQGAATRAYAGSAGLNITATFSAIGRNGHFIGDICSPASYSKLSLLARATKAPILAFDWLRFCREPHKFARFPDVRFVSLTSLVTDPRALPGIWRRAANAFDPSKKGGRKPDIAAYHQLPFILCRLGRSWREIAREMELGWDHKKVKRVLDANFHYVPI